MKVKKLWLLPNLRHRRQWALVVVLAFAGIGAALVLVSRAASLAGTMSSTTKSPVERRQYIQLGLIFRNNTSRRLKYRLKLHYSPYTSIYAQGVGADGSGGSSWNGSIDPGGAFKTSSGLIVGANAPCGAALKSYFSYSTTDYETGAAKGSGNSSSVIHTVINKCASINTFSASDTSTYVGRSIVLRWSTGNTTKCTASGSWSGSKAASGSQTIAGPSTPQTRTYTLSCPSRYSGYSSAKKSISVKYASRPSSSPTAPSTAPAQPAPAPRDTARPSQPTSFKASTSSAAGLLLTWHKSSDKGTGVSHYVLQRSSDNKSWKTLSVNIRNLHFQDTSADRKSDYYYRLQAVDKANNKSSYAQIKYAGSVAGPVVTFTNTVSSPDNRLTVNFGDGTFEQNSNCTLAPTEGTDIFTGLSKPTVAGPYTLDCRQENGQLATFRQPAHATLNLNSDPEIAKQELESYRDFEVAYVDSSNQLAYLTPQVDETSGQVNFDVASPGSMALIGAIPEAGASWWPKLIPVIALFLGGLVAMKLIEKRRKSKALAEYQKLYEQYEGYDQPAQTPAPTPTLDVPTPPPVESTPPPPVPPTASPSPETENPDSPDSPSSSPPPPNTLPPNDEVSL